MYLTQQEINDILQDVQLTHLQFMGLQLGLDILTADDIQTLVDNGFDLNQLTASGALDDMYKFGILAAGLSVNQFRALTYLELKDFVNSSAFRVLTPYEINTLNAIKRQAYTDIKGLGNRVSADLSQTFIEVDKKLRQQYEDLIRREAARAVYYRRSRDELARSLGRATKDWSRNFFRISSYLMHAAYDEGRAAQIRETFGDDAIVWKEVLAGACDSCRKLYLKDQDSGEPRLFKLSALIANGSNIGVVKAAWKPVVGPTHPFCRCNLKSLAPGSVWDSQNRRFRIGPVQAAPGKIQFQPKNRVKISFQ